MFELMVRLELKRQAIRKRLLSNTSDSGDSYFALAALIALVSVPVCCVCPPLVLIEAPVAATAVVGLVIVGLFMCFTIILAPVGFLFF